MNTSSSEALSYTREARRSQELANRLESQASLFSSRNAAGSLNLSQAYREWGLAEMDRNRDFYGAARFDDTAFQISPAGQALQAKFVESYAEEVRAGVAGKLALPPKAPIERPAAPGGTAVGSSPRRQSRRITPPDNSAIHNAVSERQAKGAQAIQSQRSELERLTKDAKGASAAAADEIKKWPE
jgi:conjugal transfer mating pair stabilization protein TraG